MKEKETHGSNVTFLNRNRKPFLIHLSTVMLMIALCMIGLKSNALAQSCMEQCQQALASCMVAAQGNPVEEVRCQNVYDKCGEDCM
jgi:hypothetical protein